MKTMKKNNTSPNTTRHAVKRTLEQTHDAAEKNLPLSQRELAAVMCCCPETIQAYTRQGMPCVYMGRKQGGKGSRPIYRYLDCMAWLDKRNANR